MNAPRHPGPYPGRHIDCQAAAEDEFAVLLDWMVEAGWGRAESLVAMTDLADRYALADATDATISAEIEAMLRRR